MNRIARRGFLGLLGATGLSAFLPPKLRAEAEGKTVVNLHIIAYEIALAMEVERKRRGLKPFTLATTEPSRLGDHRLYLRRYVQFQDCVGVHDVDDIRERYCRPVGEILEASLERAGVERVAPLLHPRGGAESALVVSKERGIALRVVRAYDIREDNYTIRADVLGGKA